VKLFWSSRSPYARKAWVAAHELGLETRIELRPTLALMSQEDPELAVLSPLVQIPVLLCDGEAPIFDSIVICEWLDMRFGAEAGVTLFPADPPRRLSALRRHAVADGAIAYMLALRAEHRRPPELRKAELVATWTRRVGSALDFVEKEAGDLLPDVDIGTISMAILLAYHDFRLGTDWRETRPNAARWYDRYREREAMRRTEFRD